MYVLGIETSCDETSAAVVEDGRRLLSNVTSSSLKFHQRYGGVIPEIAFRAQLETIAQVTDSSLKVAKVELKEIKLISVTSGPGLLGSLLVGICFAKGLAFSRDIPLLGVNHLHSHIYANFLEQEKIKFPFVALVVSGGHSSLFYAWDFGRIRLLGSTQDDACGESFDKVAKILNLGYPGGPIIERIARKGNPRKIRFQCSGTTQPLNFSFSGIKTAVLYYVRNKGHKSPLDCARGRQVRSHPLTTLRASKSDIAASFQEAVIDTLIRKSLLACKLKKTKRLLVGGGVAANNRLKEKFFFAAKQQGVKCLFPPRELCVDNAAMVAGLGYQLFRRGLVSDLSLTAS